MNPLDDYLEMKKQAIQLPLPGFRGTVGGAIRRFGRTVINEESRDTAAKAFGAGALGAAGAAAFGGLQAAGKKILGAGRKRQDFSEMMEAHPDLQDVQQENPRFFNQAYSSLRRMNPTYAKDPMIAGSYMKKMMASPDTAGLTLAQSFKQPAPVTEPGIDVRGAYGPVHMQF